MYAHNPAYNLIHTSGRYNIYALKDENIQQLHKSREVEASIQNVYSNAGATAEYIQQLCEAGIKMLENDAKSETLRQNMMAIMNQLLYRTRYPVDALCGIRMGAILSFMEYRTDEGVQSEPEDIQIQWLNMKVQLALDDPKMYDFFLTWGVASTPSYYSHLSILSDRDYFNKRTEMLASLNPFPKP